MMRTSLCPALGLRIHHSYTTCHCSIPSGFAFSAAPCFSHCLAHFPLHPSAYTAQRGLPYPQSCRTALFLPSSCNVKYLGGFSRRPKSVTLIGCEHKWPGILTVAGFQEATLSFVPGLLALPSLLTPLLTLPPGFLLQDLASQTPQEVPELESLPRIIFNGFMGCSPGQE